MDTPTSLSASFLIHRHYLSPFLSIYVASLSQVSASSSSWFWHTTLHIPFVLRHTLVLSTSRRLHELNILDSALAEPLECQDELWYSDMVLWPHTALLGVSVCVTHYLTLHHIQHGVLSHLVSFMFYLLHSSSCFFFVSSVSRLSPSLISVSFLYMCCFQLMVAVKIDFFPSLPTPPYFMCTL